MPERQKPIVPRREDLWLERESENATLLGKDEMLKNLREIFAGSDTFAETEERFFPFLLERAGETVPVSQVPAIILDAIHKSAPGPRVNLRSLIAKYVPAIIDAVLAREDDRRLAREFLASAING